MKTLSAIANGYDDNLISRAAGVTLKEGRRLVICPRETPLSAIHLENMLKLARLGVSVLPPMPAFYNEPETIDDIIHSHITKILDCFGIPAGDTKRWG
jgi:4-hydroxy-3-polyprenylbenzoate decarboxylase